MREMADLVLGTAQFGDGYGVTNASRRLDDQTVESILDEATRRGITLFDTATEYGEAQDRIAKLMPATHNPHYVTKFSLDHEALPTAESIYARSMRRLRAESLYGLLFHKASDLKDSRARRALDIVRSARANGIIQRLGVSVYDLSELELAVSIIPDLDLVQFPGSIIDARLTTDKIVGELHGSGVEVHVRSAFLQGLLLQPPQALDSRFAALRPVLSMLDDAAERAGVNRLSLLLGALRARENVDAIVVGATTPRELRATIDAWSADATYAEVDLPKLPKELLDPRFWV